jgi:hypothetical protein
MFFSVTIAPPAMIKLNLAILNTERKQTRLKICTV